MEIRSAMSMEPDTGRAFVEATAALGQPSAPAIVLVMSSSDHDIDALRGLAANRFDCAVHGATSSLGVMTQVAHSIDNGTGLGVFVVFDRDGDFGSVARPLGEDPHKAAAEALRAALKQADRPGESPELIWVSCTPGQEESVLAGLQSVVGTEVPIIGGSAADNSVSGDWAVFDRDAVMNDGVTVSVFFPSGEIADVFLNGYHPTGWSGSVTRASGRRVYEIDGRPATDVYREWTGGALDDHHATEDPANVLILGTRYPLGRPLTRIDGKREFLLVHPVALHADGSIEMFAELPEGSVLTQMNVDPAELPGRVARAVRLANEDAQHQSASPVGAIVVICAGYVHGVKPDMDQVLSSLRAEMGAAPFLGVFTFGEQGRFRGCGNLHGNLMISCVTFSA